MFTMKIKKYVTPVKRKAFNILQWISLLCSLCLIATVQSKSDDKHTATLEYRLENQFENLYRFSHNVYNVTIPENSLGKTYAKGVLHERLAGMRVGLNSEVKYRIISGDKDKLFKAEEKLVGDFAFLAIRTRTNNVVLNREKTEEYVIRVKAHVHLHDRNISSYETEANIHIKVLDRNDLSPLFYPTQYTVVIPEDTPKYQSILKVTADDADLGINGEIYYSLLMDSEYFAIHPTTGEITLLQQLQYAENSHFELTVLAYDRGSWVNHQNHQASKAKVSISVKQVNFYAPEMFTKTFSSVTPTSNPLIYGIVRVNDKDIGVNGNIGRLEIVDGNPDGTFLLKAAETKDEYYIELNKFAHLSEQHFIYNLTLRAEDLGTPRRFSYKSVPIQIKPESKNIPIFTQEIYEVSIPETAPINMPVIRLKVSDPDLGKNALVYLEIVGGNEGDEFRINPDSGMLYTAKQLDAESKSSYTLTVSAIDQANVGSRKQSSAKVKISVQDMNDNDPIFENVNKVIAINENNLAGSFVVKLTAKDRDSGENSYISYSIANLNTVPFEIDHFSGIVKTTSLIDFETMKRNYELIIRASDWGLPYRRQTEVKLSIVVKDINDNRPQFERVNCFGKVTKSAPMGTEVFVTSAIDFDAGDIISYRLSDGNEDGCFNLDPTSGSLSISCDLKKTSLTNRILKVSATDGTHFSDEQIINVHLMPEDLGGDAGLMHGYGSFECRETGVARRLAESLALAEKNNVKSVLPSVFSDLSLTPSRYGQNVHRPEFVNFPQELSINESVQLGETVAWIEAKDRDLGYNGKLVFAISDGDYDSVFRIDPDRGELQIIGYLDRERQNEYVLNITVYDLGNPTKSMSKMLPITILDVNDNRPVIQKTLATFRLTESARIGTVVHCIHATDADTGVNAQVTYALSVECSDFTVNATTGCIRLNRPLDREKQDSYALHITAKDGGNPVLSSEALVYVLVDDVNDNAPVFGVQEYIFKVREDLPRGTVLAVIEAVDEDIGPNAEILFSLKEETQDEELFRIDKHTGAIRTQGYLDYENKQVHNLIVSAIDGGDPSLTSDMSIVIVIIDVNENRFAPEFDDFVYEGRIKENKPKGTFVMNVTARDLDTVDLNSKITYSITGGDGLGIFAVNDQGSITSLSQLDAETKNFYWLTLCAQDCAIVPLSNCVEVYIEVENENDNIPLTSKPVYYVNVTEASAENVEIITLNAVDPDIDPTQTLTYNIVSGNLVGYFEIDSKTGVIKTTERKLDRENQAEHILEVSISDNGSPVLSSTSRIVVSVLDINDNSPEFDQRVYKVQVPSSATVNQSIFQVHAIDSDSGENGRITYSIKSGKGKNKFRIDSQRGHIHIAKPLESDNEFEIHIKAEDNGIPKKSQTARVNIVVVPVNPNSKNAPLIVKRKSSDNVVDLTENDKPGFLVTQILAVDDDNDQLWYNISNGNEENTFYIGQDNGNILLSKYLDYETKSSYNLTISVTDGTFTSFTNLLVQVIDINDNPPQFAKDAYHVNISENIEEESVIMQLHATDRDEDKKLFYHLHATQDPSSLALFRIDSISGNVIVTQRLDFEKTAQHILIVFVKDQGAPGKRNYAKIIVNVHDHNDHHPEFTAKIIQSKVPESAAIGSKLAEVRAIDRDSGHNAEIQYSIITGNVGSVFEIDPTFGVITLAGSLNINKIQEYMLQVKAVDLGSPPLSSQIPVHIIVTMSENDPPKFSTDNIAIEIFENLGIGTFVTQVTARSSSSIFFNIISGNINDSFRINPSTGVIVINGNIDYEQIKVFNLTVKGTNMAAESSCQNIIIHILDANDNIPYFVQNEYVGTLSESAAIGSYVLKVHDSSKDHLTLQVRDADVGVNGMVEYHINDDLAKNVFKIDSTTGAIELLSHLDYETNAGYTFDVTVSDMGKPKLHSTTTAHVTIRVINVNDCPPVFNERELNVTLFLPTFENVFVAQINAKDADNDTLRFDIVDGNMNECFQIEKYTGIITTRNFEILNNENDRDYTLHVRASDGIFSAILIVKIKVLSAIDSNFAFQRESYRFSAFENNTKVATIGLVNVVGNSLNENVEYRILNPTKLFDIGISSGALKTTGVIFDREAQDLYKLFVEAKSLLFNGLNSNVRRAVTSVYISVLDVNDNCPLFVNMPYYATVSIDDPKGTIIMQVKAIDLDSGENGEVRYELKKGNGELFKLDRKTGELSIKQHVEGHNRNYELTVAAYDGAITPCSSEAPLQVKVIDRSMPVFEKQFYSVSVKEDVEMYSALSVSIEAESPLGRNLIYTISSDSQSFEIDYNTGSIFVVNELDYEQMSSHDVSIRATDSLSGVYAEVVLSVAIIDVNDCYPEIESDIYNITIPENSSFGTQILKINATDKDSGANAKLSYYIESINGQNNSELFYIDVSDGNLYLKTPLDFEQTKYHHIVVNVKDHGSPSLSSRSNIFITVKDLNDNPPCFVEPSYFTKLSVAAVRGQFVALPKAYDKDISDTDSLEYKIVYGNELQTYSINKLTGVISLQNMLNFTDKSSTVLNISVSDGVHTAYARLKISLLPENVYSPQFERSNYEAQIPENLLHGHNIITVKATDGDFGTYSSLYYEIVSEEMKKFFLIDRSTGVITSKVTFDREKRDEYMVLLKVSDGGGKFGFATLKVIVVDVNDNVPYFLLKEYKIVISTTTEANSTILTVKAKDDDINENGSVHYQIVQKSNDAASKDVIEINENTGDIVLKQDAASFGVGSFQFFVRASDGGEPQFYSEVPVSIEIIDTDSSIPIFEKSSILLKIIESTPPGTVLTKLHTIGNFTFKFSIAAEQDLFIISDSGELILQQTLDREQQESHNLIVVAETATVPVLFAYADVSIEVRDENDNYPKFDNTFYSASVAENSEKVISLVKVSATDADTGPNGDIRYYLESDTENIQNIFDIDIYSGWITLLTSLDREVQSEYNFKVIAADNGHPKHDAKVPVTIKIVDYNDNAPAFKLPIERLSVLENALPGTVLVNLLLIDPDIEKQEMDFFIVSGDKQAQFQIGKSGELFIAKPLDREQIVFYNLSIIATDGKFTAKANVEVDVKDINDNTPYCLKPRYHIATNESISIGTTLVEVKAVDFDLQSKLRFYLSGKGADDFTIGKESGILKVANSLDRETTPKYKLVAHVQDGKDFTQECFSEVIITVNDINDNTPVFSMAQYRVSVPEDAQLNTLITKVHAMDKDFGVNRQIKYSLMGENHDYFKISKSTGIIRLDKNLDRETISLFNLTVKAEDCGIPKLHSIATVAVNILDINDNPPEFSMRQYSCKILENAPHGTEVCKVFAASIDIGVNADIHYFIMSGNEQGKFRMDSLTGELSLNATLDYEMSKFYFLTIQAIDGGTPPLSNNAYVNVSILDINDNSPKFLQNFYRVNVNEDISVGSRILDVKATDEDSGVNGLVTYNIERGDNIGQFSIDEKNGTIRVSRPLDRETISHYDLEIQACDQGVPQSCNSVPVKVNISDTNDNAPLFSSANYSVVLQENRPLGYVFLTFKVSDADEPPNTTPYTFDIRSGNEGGLFRLEKDGSLGTASRFNHNLQDEFVIQVRVFDNGTPPLYSDAWVVVKIIEESQYPPIVTPLEVTINSFEDDFSGAFIGKVHASDQDKYDELNFGLVSGPEDMYQSSKLFNISSKTGKIYAISNLDIGLYKLNVSVSDGKYHVFSIVRINVELVTSEMLKESVVIRFSRVSASEFLLSHRKTFMRSIRNIMRCRQKDVILITLQSESPRRSATNRYVRSIESDLNVVFAVRKQQIIPDSDEFFTSDEIRQTLVEKKNEIENETNLVVEEVLPSSCQSKQNSCVHGECKQILRIQKNNVTTTFTDVISFAAPSYNQVNRCVCRPGFDGKHCNETVNACSTDPCSPQRICMPSGSAVGYQCVCPKGYSGTYCERKSSKCSNESCDIGQFTAVSFGGKSYAHYKINKVKAKFTLENEFSYSLQIRTVQQTGTLLYASGKVDYNILEIINGAVQYRFDLGSGEGVISVSSINISDGEWHFISLERSLNSAKLMVDNKHVSHGSAPGVNGILNIQSNDIFVGAEVRPHPSIIGYEDIQRGFIGCMANIKIAKESLPLYISGGSTIAALKRFTNVEFKCDPSNVLVRLGICGSQPCANSGICKELDTDVFECACQPRYSGKHCEIDLDPCSSGPCLFGGRCDYHGPNNYSCTCPIHLSGRRCEYGKFCTPNPCKNGGICEEGDGISHCMCRGYTGPTCEIDVDECENQPCGNGATCINEPGSFRCICPSYLTGASCGDPLYSNSISTKLKNFSIEHISGIISGVAVVLVIISCVLCCVVIKRNSSSKRRNRLEKDKNKPSYKEANLNSLVDKDNYCKPNVKLSNLEVNQRPISYTAAPNDNLFLSNRNFVNNLDMLRSYGSAGDELENVPFEYQKVNRNKQHVNINTYHSAETDNAYKQEWCEQMHLRTFSENKLNNELKRDFGPSVSRFSTGKLIQVEMPNVCHSSSANFVDYSALANGQYHWDCSDWVRKSHNPLPDITEVPGAEIADSSSLHSNDSNESKSKKAFFVHREDGDVDPTRDIAALNEDIGSEYLDSEAESCLEPFMLPRSSNQPLSRLSSFNNIENEDYKSNTGKVYLRHPDSYLPTMHFPSETDGESSMTEGPISRKEMKARRTISENSEEAYLFPCAVGEIGSNSNISVRLCEIEDSELEEFLPQPQQQTNN